MAQTRLTAVGEEPVPEFIGTTEHIPQREPLRLGVPRQRVEDAFTSILWTSLKALSQRTIVALAALVDLLLMASAFALWLLIISNPTAIQLYAVAGYSLFVLACIWMRRRV